MEREVGGGIGMGNTCKPMAVSFQCRTKSTTNLKKKEKKKETAEPVWSWGDMNRGEVTGVGHLRQELRSLVSRALQPCRVSEAWEQEFWQRT